MTAALADITAEHARSLTDRIKVAVEGTWHLITEAYTSRAWAALGYTSWDDYCTREFGTSRLRLPREDRSGVVGSLRDAGLSVRAIAAATGASVGTIHADLKVFSSEQVDGSETAALLADPDAMAAIAEAGAETWPADDDDAEPALTQEECEALDRSSKPDWEVAGEEAVEFFESLPLTDAEQAAAAEQIEVEAKPRITGIDGKSYPKPEPKKPQRRALTESARELGIDTRKFASRIEKFKEDDRLPRNAEQVAPHLRHHLIQLVEVCQDLLDQIPSN